MSYDNNDSINNNCSNIIVVWLVSTKLEKLTLYNSNLLQYQHNLPLWKCNEIKVYEINIRNTIKLIIEQPKLL